MGLHVWAAILVMLSNAVTAEYTPGDFVPTARKGQFHGTRTQWHDVLGRHCPRFAIDRTVAMPIPRPVGYLGDEEYKLSLSFEGERHITEWMTVLPGQRKMSESSWKPTIVNVHMDHTAGHVRSVRAQLTPIPDAYYQSHKEELSQIANASHWPKHVIVRYTWSEVVEVNSLGGMNFLLGTGAAMMGLVLYIVVKANHEKIAKLVQELADDEDKEEEKDD
mmetsp:Transcript_1737/g.3516  ORF Transcript_1737/g.3516 Transcript_1737/m.3516 type:complete len:220 (-) Transcript_1737:122-781(-)|eukprot:CAMPEP_0118932130 /NCGR_PEP_ID=MMETSP1169-20130426/9177_1 /TAXON_ID=36882 /ORGANISM="Pyramimonas obovata, Strain CCMP722" /LENGTH=219 /DNA_ID=CAMNT_0006874737 /DNA_START=237 /DNA_END=896 /DNA_ORIENTATION=+